MYISLIYDNSVTTQTTVSQLKRQCHNSKSVIFQDRLLKVLKCYNFLWAQRRHNCSPAAYFANWVMTLYLLKVHLQTSLSIPITQKCQISSCDTLVTNERYYTHQIIINVIIGTAGPSSGRTWPRYYSRQLVTEFSKSFYTSAILILDLQSVTFQNSFSHV